MFLCLSCNEESVIKVAENGGLDFFSCCNEKCKEYSELLVETNGRLAPVHDMLNAYREIVEELTNEKNKIR